MPFLHGKNTVFEMWDTSGASATVSGDFNNVVFNLTRNNPQTTTFGKDYEQRISGIRDYNISITAVYNSDTASGFQVTAIGHISTGSGNVLFRWYPAGKTTGCEFWTGCALPNNYQETAPLNGPVALAITFESSSGSLSASTV